MAKPIVILGAGEFGAVASRYLRDAGHKIECHIVDDARYKAVQDVDGIGVMVCGLDEMERHFSPRYFDCVVAIGYSKLNANRVKKCEALAAKGYELNPFIHPQVRNYGKVGRGCFVFEHNTIQPFTEIGDWCVIWSGNHLGHHSRIGSGCFITSHVCVSGSVTIGECCFIGVNATVNDGVTIGARSIVQSGAVVAQNIPDESVFSRDGLTRIPSSKVKL